MITVRFMGERIWSVGDVCYLADEGDEVFVVERITESTAALFGHGEEVLEVLIELDEVQLATALDSLVTRIAVLEVQAVQVWAAKLKREVAA